MSAKPPISLMKRKRLVAGIGALLLPLCAHADLPTLQNPGTAQQAFPAGVYFYSIPGVSWDSITMESHLRYLAGQGINVIHVNGLALTDTSTVTILDLAKKHGIKVIYQIDSAYYLANTSPSTAYGVINTVRGSAAADAALAFSVKEEPTSANISGLFSYYSDIQGGAGSVPVPFYLLHNDTSAMQAVYDNYTNPASAVLPVLTGGETYTFNWDYCSSGGYITTPTKAFWLLTEPSFYHSVQKFVANTNFDEQRYYAVITGNALREKHSLTALETLCSTTSTPVPQRWKDLAAAGNQGLAMDSTGDYMLSWKYYHPPKGGMSAQAWLSVAEGAQGVMAWSADPDSSHQTIGPDSYNIGLFDEVGTPHAAFGELAQVARDLKPFGSIINAMRRDSSSDASAVTASVPVFTNSALSNAAAPDSSKIIRRAFSVNGVSGRVVVLVNSYVGTWAGNSTDFLWQGTPYENYRIDTNGNLISSDYTPALPLLVDLTPSSGNQVFDFATGLALSDHDGGSAVDTTVPAGSGKLLYVGTQADFNTLRANAGLSTTYPIAGNAMLSADTRALLDQRLVIPSNPLTASGGDVVANYSLGLGKRYRFDMTTTQASGVDVKLANADGSGTEQSIYSGTISGVQHAVSNEFVTSGSVAQKLVVHNGGGALTIKDAWLKDLSSETRLTAYFVSHVLYDPTKSHTAQFTVRALPGETATLGVRWFNCHEITCSTLYPSNGYDLVSWGTSVSTNSTSYQVSIPATSDSLAVRQLLVIYRANYGAVAGQTLVIEQASAWDN